jgi:hypothetical protein
VSGQSLSHRFPVRAPGRYLSVPLLTLHNIRSCSGTCPAMLSFRFGFRFPDRAPGGFEVVRPTRSLSAPFHCGVGCTTSPRGLWSVRLSVSSKVRGRFRGRVRGQVWWQVSGTLVWGQVSGTLVWGQASRLSGPCILCTGRIGFWYWLWLALVSVVVYAGLRVIIRVLCLWYYFVFWVCQWCWERICRGI